MHLHRPDGLQHTRDPWRPGLRVRARNRKMVVPRAEGVEGHHCRLLGGHTPVLLMGATCDRIGKPDVVGETAARYRHGTSGVLQSSITRCFGRDASRRDGSHRPLDRQEPRALHRLGAEWLSIFCGGAHSRDADPAIAFDAHQLTAVKWHHHGGRVGDVTPSVGRVAVTSP